MCVYTHARTQTYAYGIYEASQTKFWEAVRMKAGIGYDRAEHA